ncbi:MAG: hypothetical protein QXP04_03935, partial [Candidatus Nanoarchaeia archaeon]|nr:hypothetical protein [Candidatus Jingweiarchaeum tengchongense]
AAYETQGEAEAGGEKTGANELLQADTGNAGMRKVIGDIAKGFSVTRGVNIGGIIGAGGFVSIGMSGMKISTNNNIIRGLTPSIKFSTSNISQLGNIPALKGGVRNIIQPASKSILKSATKTATKTAVNTSTTTATGMGIPISQNTFRPFFAPTTKKAPLQPTQLFPLKPFLRRRREGELNAGFAPFPDLMDVNEVANTGQKPVALNPNNPKTMQIYRKYMRETGGMRYPTANQILQKKGKVKKNRKTSLF